MNLIRTLAATALQIGIAAGVFLMIEIQRKVAVRDDSLPKKDRIEPDEDDRREDVDDRDADVRARG